MQILTVRVEKMRKTSDKNLSFLVIAHTGSHGFGPDLVGIFWGGACSASRREAGHRILDMSGTQNIQLSDVQTKNKQFLEPAGKT